MPRAHPHVCGEHCDPIGPAPSPEGSSPRMRGTPANGCGVVGFSGLIPTYAGNTKIFDTKPGGARAHPHVCGEHCSNRETPEASPGSSPRMRGTPFYAFLKILKVGLIPTYAGNTIEKMSRGWYNRAHPHVCGEHGGVHVHHKRFMGSSPRMRGTRFPG